MHRRELRNVACGSCESVGGSYDQPRPLALQSDSIGQLFEAYTIACSILKRGWTSDEGWGSTRWITQRARLFMSEKNKREIYRSSLIIIQIAYPIWPTKPYFSTRSRMIKNWMGSPRVYVNKWCNTCSSSSYCICIILGGVIKIILCGLAKHDSWKYDFRLKLSKVSKLFRITGFLFLIIWVMCSLQFTQSWHCLSWRQLSFDTYHPTYFVPSSSVFGKVVICLRSTSVDLMPTWNICSNH